MLVNIPARHILTHPCTAKEFAEASFRVKRNDFNPTVPWNAESGEPGTHIVLAVFGCLINEINKCCASFTDASISSCATMIDVCNSYAKKKDDFLASLHALPIKSITDQALKLTRNKEEKAATKATGASCKADVDKMKTVDDLCAVVVTLISNARAASGDTGASMRVAAIFNALDDFDWAKCKIGNHL